MLVKTSVDVLAECVCGRMLDVSHAYLIDDNQAVVTVKPCPVCTKERQAVIQAKPEWFPAESADTK